MWLKVESTRELWTSWLATILFLSCVARANDRRSQNMKADRVVVIKHEHKLTLLGHGKVLKQYKVALGGDPSGPKMRQGDHKPPEGVYTLDHRNAHSLFYHSNHISYPNVQDRAPTDLE